MVIRTFLDKATTIVSGSDDNFGLNPICMLSYGPTISRILVHFNIDKIKEEIGYNPKAKHILKMTNCASLESSSSKDILDSPNDMGYKKRAASFKIMALRLPDYERYSWDEGNGFDDSKDFWLAGDASVSTNGASWFKPYNGNRWGENSDGALSDETIAKEIESLHSIDNTDSAIVARQTFDHGNENMSLDITSYVNDIISEKHKNNGLLICFYPNIEKLNVAVRQYVGFFSNTTRTFFEPVVESRIDTSIKDDRNNFISGKENRLFCYLREDGKLFDSKTMPICKIDGSQYEVKRLRKGVYYAIVTLKGAPQTIKYDEWSNITFEDGTLLTEPESIENEFVIKSRNSLLSIGSEYQAKGSFSCSCSGINKYERINQGDERIVKVDFRIPYSNDNAKNIRDVEYRLYVMDGKNEIDVIEYDKADITSNGIMFILRTGEYVPNEYYVDIKAKLNDETRIFKKELNFTVVDNATERNI